MKKMQGNIPQVGIDFDGVLAYNPFRIIRAPVTFVKEQLLQRKETAFFVPKTSVEKFAWKVLHESSVLPANGVDLLRRMVNEQQIEAHLVTARYSFLQDQLYVWLRKHDLEKLFSSITINKLDEQPHIYKSKIIKQQKFDYFIEDNLDIVKHVSDHKATQTLWIYNLLDRHQPYTHKYPHLKHALEHIAKNV